MRVGDTLSNMGWKTGRQAGRPAGIEVTMCRLIVITGLMSVLLFAGALPALATDRALLGSGAVAPESREAPAVPVDDGAVTHVAEAEVTQVSQAVGEDALAATGFDTGSVLLVGLGLMAAGGAGVATSRKRMRR